MSTKEFGTILIGEKINNARIHTIPTSNNHMVQSIRIPYQWTQMKLIKYLIGALYTFVILFLIVFIVSLAYGGIMETIKYINK